MDAQLKQRAISVAQETLAPILAEHADVPLEQIHTDTALCELEPELLYRHELTITIEESLGVEIPDDHEDAAWNEGTVAALAWVVFLRVTDLRAEAAADDVEAGIHLFRTMSAELRARAEAAAQERAQRLKEAAEKRARAEEARRAKKAAIAAEIARHEPAFRQAFEAICPPTGPSLFGRPPPYVPSGALITALDQRFETDLAKEMRGDPPERRLRREELYALLKDAFFHRLEKSWPQVAARSGGRFISAPEPAWLRGPHPLRGYGWAALLCLLAAWAGLISLLGRALAVIAPQQGRAPSLAALFETATVESVLLSLAFLPPLLVLLLPRAFARAPEVPEPPTKPKETTPKARAASAAYAPENRLSPAPRLWRLSDVGDALMMVSTLLFTAFLLFLLLWVFSAALLWALAYLWLAAIILGVMVVLKRAAARRRRALQHGPSATKEQAIRREEETARRIDGSYLTFLAAALAPLALLAFSR